MLVVCILVGIIFFVLKVVGGLMSDKECVKRFGIVDFFFFGDIFLVDRGFNI